MANVTMTQSTNMLDLNVNRMYAYGWDYGLLNDANTLYAGKVYEDLYVVDWYFNSTYWGSIFGGSNMSADSNGVINGGDATAYLETYWDGSQYIPYFYIDGFSTNVMNIYNVATTPSTTDDYTLISSLLSGNDRLYGSAGSDGLLGFSGDDVFVPSAGADYVDGGAGTDSVIINGNRGAMSRVGEQWQTSGKTLVNVEHVHFNDGSVGLDQTSEKAYRIYKAAFDRTPDEEGLGYWISVLDDGTSINTVSNAFIVSAEFQALYGENPTTETFLTALYNNVLDRDPDAGGLNYWQGLIDDGTLSRAEVLANFSESAENIANTDPLIELGVVYQPYGDALIG